MIHAYLLEKIVGFGYIYRMAKRFSKKKKKEEKKEEEEVEEEEKRLIKKKAYSIQFILFNGNLTINIKI